MDLACPGAHLPSDRPQDPPIPFDWAVGRGIRVEVPSTESGRATCFYRSYTYLTKISGSQCVHQHPVICLMDCATGE